MHLASRTCTCVLVLVSVSSKGSETFSGTRVRRRRRAANIGSVSTRQFPVSPILTMNSGAPSFTSARSSCGPAWLLVPWLQRGPLLSPWTVRLLRPLHSCSLATPIGPLRLTWPPLVSTTPSSSPPRHLGPRPTAAPPFRSPKHRNRQTRNTKPTHATPNVATPQTPPRAACPTMQLQKPCVFIRGAIGRSTSTRHSARHQPSWPKTHPRSWPGPSSPIISTARLQRMHSSL